MIQTNTINTKWVAWGLGFYSVLILTSMASMSLGIGVVLVSLLAACQGPRGLLQLIQSEFFRKDQRELRRYFGLTVFLTLACAVSLIGASINPLSYGGHGPVVSFFSDMAKSWYFFWPLVLVPALRLLTEKQKQGVLLSWLIAFALFSILGIFQYFLGWPKAQGIPFNEPRYHATLFLGHHLSVASIFSFPFFIALDLTRKTVFPKTFLVPVLIVGLTALIATYSRMLWVALPIGMLIWFAWILPRKWAVFTIFMSGVAAGLLSKVPAINTRMSYFGGVSERKLLWQANYEFFKARPMTGVGWHHNLELSGYYLKVFGNPYNPIFSGHAHSNFFEVMGSLGVLGLVAWFTWNFFVISLPIRYRKSSGAYLARGVTCAWIVFQINGLTQVNFWESKVIHSMMWIVAWTLVWAADARQSESQGLIGSGS